MVAKVVETISSRYDFPIGGEAYVVGKLDDGRFFFAWGPKYPYVDQIPAYEIENGESGLSFHETKEEARKAMLKAIRVVFKSREPKRWYMDRVFVRDEEVYDHGYYFREDGFIEWIEPMRNGLIHEFPIEECFHEDGSPIDIADGELFGEIISGKKEFVKQIFLDLYHQYTDWGFAADIFIAWVISKDFQSESFDEFVDRIANEEINDTKHFFFGYVNNFEKFAVDWITEEERESYLAYCREHA